MATNWNPPHDYYEQPESKPMYCADCGAVVAGDECELCGCQYLTDEPPLFDDRGFDE